MLKFESTVEVLVTIVLKHMRLLAVTKCVSFHQSVTFLSNVSLLNRLLDKLRALVTMNENLKQQEQEFRTHCRVSINAITVTVSC